MKTSCVCSCVETSGLPRDNGHLSAFRTRSCLLDCVRTGLGVWLEERCSLVIVLSKMLEN